MENRHFLIGDIHLQIGCFSIVMLVFWVVYDSTYSGETKTVDLLSAMYRVDFTPFMAIG